MRTVVVLIFAIITVCRAELSVDTPGNVVTCQNTLLTWSGGAANDSYKVEIPHPTGDLTTTEGYSGITTPYWSWFVDVKFPANTQTFVRIVTSTGETAQSGVFTIQAGVTQTCHNVIAQGRVSTSSLSSGSITGTSGLLTSQSNSTSLLSRTSTGTSSDPTVVSGPSPGDTSPPSSSPNVGLIAGAAGGGGSAALMLLLLGMCLYRRRKRSVGLVEKFHPIEMKAEENLPVTRHHLYSRYDSTIPMEKPYSSTKSHEFSALTSQRVHSEPRMTRGTAVSLAITSSYVTSSFSGTSEPIEDPLPMYLDEVEAQIQSQWIQAEEAERVRRYNALIADFCASNRDLISLSLQRKLHAARYLPMDNPSDVDADYWLTTYGVELSEVRKLQTAHERYVATQALVNMPGMA